MVRLRPSRWRRSLPKPSSAKGLKGDALSDFLYSNFEDQFGVPMQSHERGDVNTSFKKFPHAPAAQLTKEDGVTARLPRGGYYDKNSPKLTKQAESPLRKLISAISKAN